MTIAVTAATGQLGSLVIDALLDKVPAGEIVAIARNAEKAQPLQAKGVDVRIASYDDRAALEEALTGVDAVLLISGNEIGRRQAQHANVIDAAKAQRVSLVAYTSAPQADTSTLPMAPEHLQTEQYLASSGVDHVLLRNGWYNENYEQALATAAQTGTLLTSAGDGRIASAARKDLAEAAAVVLTTDGPLKPVYELTGDSAWTQDELAAAMSDALGKPVTAQHVSTDEHIAILQQIGLDEGTATFLAALDTATAHGDLAQTTGELAALIGHPTTPLVESLRVLV